MGIENTASRLQLFTLLKCENSMELTPMLKKTCDELQIKYTLLFAYAVLALKTGVSL